MTFDHKLVDEFLKAVSPLPEHFGVICYSDRKEEPVYFNFFQEAVKKVDPNAVLYFGMSKIVITSPLLNNIVIKIPFNGCFEEGYYDYYDWTPFEWASGSDNADYCLTEFEKYKKLKTYGLDCFVAKTLFYKKINNVRIFLQEYVIPESNSCSIHIPSKKSQGIAYRWKDEGKICIDINWIANCLDKYGKSKVERFLNYCDNIDLDILEDIHKGNFGYRRNGTPCLLDFSSFNN